MTQITHISQYEILASGPGNNFGTMLQSMNTSVNQAIANGWQPLGDLIFNWDGKNYTFLQVIVR